MLFEIKNRFDGSIIFSIETSSIKLCVETAIKANADLSSANLRYADLSSANLRYANLSSADLSYANLSSADLSSADLRSANLRSADLSYADLSSANLRSADLSYADLSSADLSSANLRYADLSSANLRYANLSYANLSYADLSYADLSSANLSSADLSYADLSSADLTDIKNGELIIAQQNICPTEGAFVGWKKLQGNVIAKLVIPHDAARINSIGSRKCRASKAFVHEIFGATEAYDKHSGKLLYKTGEEVVPDKFDDNLQEECSHGIHFFITRIEAENY